MGVKLRGNNLITTSLFIQKYSKAAAAASEPLDFHRWFPEWPETFGNISSCPEFVALGKVYDVLYLGRGSEADAFLPSSDFGL